MKLTAERLPLLVALGIAAIVHAPSLSLEFLSDDFGIVRQVHERGVLESLEVSFTRSYLDWALAFYRPVSASLFTLQVGVFGTSPVGYHVVSLLFMLGTGGLIFSMARKLQPGRTWAAGLIALLWLLLPSHFETLSWTIAGQQEEVASFFVAACVWLLLRGSTWSLLAALLACGSKESAFGLAAFLPLLALLHQGEDRRRVIILGLVGAALVTLAFFGRNLILGGFSLPYEQAGSPGLLRMMLGNLPHLPFACLVAAPWLGLFAAVVLLCAVVVSGRDGLRGAAREIIPLLAAPALLAPLLTLHIESLSSMSWTEVRAFAPAMAGVAVLSARAAALLPRSLVLVLLVGACGASSWLAPSAYAPFQKRSSESKRVMEALRHVAGERLLVAGLPAGHQWAWPSAGLPPFRAPGRLVYPLRAGTLGSADVVPVRPLGDAARIAVVFRNGVIKIPEQVPPAPTVEPQFLRKEGTWRLVTKNMLLRSLPSLVVTCAPGTPREECRVVLSALVPRRGTRRHVIEYLPSAGDTVVIPLIDVPEFPVAMIESLAVAGADAITTGGDYPGRMAIESPAPGTILTLDDAGLEFRLNGIPEGTRALKVNLFTAGGMGFPVIIEGQTFSFAALTDKGRPHFWYVLENGLKLGADTVYLMVEALADPANPGSLLARAPLARYRIRLD